MIILKEGISNRYIKIAVDTNTQTYYVTPVCLSVIYTNWFSCFK